MENLAEYCSNSAIESLECRYCATAFMDGKSLKAHILGEEGFIACDQVPEGLVAQVLVNDSAVSRTLDGWLERIDPVGGPLAIRSAALVCSTVRSNGIEYQTYVVWTENGIFVQKVRMGADPDNKSFTTGLSHLMEERNVEVKSFAVCITESPGKRFITGQFFNTNEKKWMFCVKSPFGDLLDVIHSLFRADETVLEWGSVLIHFLLNFQKITLSNISLRLDKFFFPEGLLWKSEYPWTREHFYDFIRKFNGIYELVQHETGLRDVTYEFDYKDFQIEEYEGIRKYSRVCNHILRSDKFWESAKFVVEVGGPLIEALSNIIRGGTAGDFYVRMGRVDMAFSESKYSDLVVKRGKKFASLTEEINTPFYKAAAFFHPTFEGVLLEEISASFAKLVDTCEKDIFDAEMLIFKARDSEPFTVGADLTPAEWWNAFGSLFPTLSKYALPLVKLPCSTHILSETEWDAMLQDMEWVRKKILVKTNIQAGYGDEVNQALFGDYARFFDVVLNLREDIMKLLWKPRFNLMEFLPCDLPDINDNMNAEDNLNAEDGVPTYVEDNSEDGLADMPPLEDAGVFDDMPSLEDAGDLAVIPLEDAGGLADMPPLGDDNF